MGIDDIKIAIDNGLVKGPRSKQDDGGKDESGKSGESLI